MEIRWMLDIGLKTDVITKHTATLVDRATRPFHYETKNISPFNSPIVFTKSAIAEPQCGF